MVRDALVLLPEGFLSSRSTLVDCRVCWFALCSYCAIVGGLRTARVFIAFALVVSVWPVAVF